MRERLTEFVAKVDAMSLRERALIFASIAFGLVSLINALFLDPLLAGTNKNACRRKWCNSRRK